MKQKRTDGAEVIREPEKNKEFVHRTVQLLETALPAYGVQVRVVEVHLEEKYVQYMMELSVGVLIEDLLKLDREITMLLSAPQMVKITAPVLGRDVVEILVPTGYIRFKKEKYKIVRITEKSHELTEWQKIRMVVGILFKKLGDGLYWLSNKTY